MAKRNILSLARQGNKEKRGLSLVKPAGRERASTLGAREKQNGNRRSLWYGFVIYTT